MIETIYFKQFLDTKLDNPKAFGLTRWFELPTEDKIDKYIREQKL